MYKINNHISLEICFKSKINILIYQTFSEDLFLKINDYFQSKDRRGIKKYIFFSFVRFSCWVFFSWQMANSHRNTSK